MIDFNSFCRSLQRIEIMRYFLLLDKCVEMSRLFNKLRTKQSNTPKRVNMSFGHLDNNYISQCIHLRNQEQYTRHLSFAVKIISNFFATSLTFTKISPMMLEINDKKFYLKFDTSGWIGSKDML